MPKSPELMVVFDIGDGTMESNTERMEAFELYHKAFNAVKISGDLPPDDVPPEELAYDVAVVHIIMEINGYKFGIFPQAKYNSRGNVSCQFEFDNEDDLRKAYDVLSQGASEHSIDTDFWCKLLAMVTDRYGVFWCLCVPN
jgi:uncharacterized glyoxalase superfamily protein PhnB